jgi:ferredoxin-NADP reductase
VIASRRILPDVFTITFESLDRPFQYRPGQFLHLALDPYDPTKSWPESRCFSIQSPPGQGACALDISFATKGVYTQRMSNELTVGREIWLKMPYGDLLAADYSSSPCVFIAGGTGVSPFLSLFLDDSFVHFAKAVLYLGVRSREYHVFARELEQARRVNSAFAVEVVREDREGRIPIEQLATRHGATSVYFISGPPAMIRSFRESLRAAGIPADHIRTDDWE